MMDLAVGTQFVIHVEASRSETNTLNAEVLQCLRKGGQGYISRVRIWDDQGQVLGQYCMKLFVATSSGSAWREIRTYKVLGSACAHVLSTTTAYLPTQEGVRIPALLMEEGRKDVLDIMESRPRENRFLSDAEAASIGVQVGTALLHAHSKRIAHRDVKPENLLLMRDGSIALADWGSAKVGQAAPDRSVFHHATAIPERNYDNVPCGSKFYSPPEARYFFTPSHVGKPVQGIRWDASAGDVWSFGVTLFVLIAGRQPWRHAHIDDPEFVAYVKASDQGPALLSMMEHIAGESGRAAAQRALVASTSKWGWSRMISTSCRHLLRSILRISYHERPHMGMVLAHPWLQSAVPLVPRRTPDSAATVGLSACVTQGALSEAAMEKLTGNLSQLFGAAWDKHLRHWHVLEKPAAGQSVESSPPHVGCVHFVAASAGSTADGDASQGTAARVELRQVSDLPEAAAPAPANPAKAASRGHSRSLGPEEDQSDPAVAQVRRVLAAASIDQKKPSSATTSNFPSYACRPDSHPPSQASRCTHACADAGMPGASSWVGNPSAQAASTVGPAAPGQTSVPVPQGKSSASMMDCSKHSVRESRRSAGDVSPACKLSPASQFRASSAPCVVGDTRSAAILAATLHRNVLAIARVAHRLPECVLGCPELARAALATALASQHACPWAWEHAAPEKVITAVIHAAPRADLRALSRLLSFGTQQQIVRELRTADWAAAPASKHDELLARPSLDTSSPPPPCGPVLGASPNACARGVSGQAADPGHACAGPAAECGSASPHRKANHSPPQWEGLRQQAERMATLAVHELLSGPSAGDGFAPGPLRALLSSKVGKPLLLPPTQRRVQNSAPPPAEEREYAQFAWLVDPAGRAR